MLLFSAVCARVPLHATIRSPTLLMVSLTIAVHQVLGRRCYFIYCCTVTTSEGPLPWSASGMHCTALHLTVEHALTFCTSPTDLVVML